MNVIKTAINGVVIIEPRIFEDSRGYFFESFSQREFEEKVGGGKFLSRTMRVSIRMVSCEVCISNAHRLPKANLFAV